MFLWEGHAPARRSSMIRLTNGILFESGKVKFRFDPRRVTEDDVCMISHAHSDHLPSSFRSSKVICSEITKDFVKARKGKDVDIVRRDDVELLDAGHIPGSNMFLVRGDKRVLYTGDFCTRDKAGREGARPRKCDALVIEATYGKPHYVFPDHGEIMSAAKDWLEDIIRGDGTAVLFAYPLGKSQELSAALKDLPLLLHPTIAENNRILLGHGYELPVKAVDERAPPEPPFIYMTSGFGKDRLRVGSFVKRGAKTAAFSGWALDRGFSKMSGTDESFPLSDHCGYDELMGFVRNCAPEVVFTTHGFAKELASKIRKELGIDAQPLVAKQRTLDHFC